MNNDYNTSQFEENDSLNLRAELEKYLIHWKWFLLGTLLALLAAFFS